MFIRQCRLNVSSVVSVPFHVINGVRQGGIMAPILFSVCMDDLSNQLNLFKSLFYRKLINHLL